MYAKACEGDNLEVIFTAPPSCAVEAHMFFADAGGVAGDRRFDIFSNGDLLAESFDMQSLPVNSDGGVEYIANLTSDERGLLVILLQRVPGSLEAPRISGVQLYAAAVCKTADKAAISTTATTGTNRTTIPHASACHTEACCADLLDCQP
jgi:hypothetical protein